VTENLMGLSIIY